MMIPADALHLYFRPTSMLDELAEDEEISVHEYLIEVLGNAMIALDPAPIMTTARTELVALFIQNEAIEGHAEITQGSIVWEYNVDAFNQFFLTMIEKMA